MVGQPREVELVQSQPAGLQARVVTPDAILVEHCARRCSVPLVHRGAARRGGGRLRALAGDGRDRQKCQEAADEDPVGHALPF